MLKSITAVFLSAILAFAAEAPKKTSKQPAKRPASSSSSSSRKRSSTKSSKGRAASRKATTARKGASSTTSGAKARTAAAKGKKGTARRSYQQAPTADRYREIQQALADKGYYQGPVNGSWSADSVDALKRFQRDQNLTETGKLDSLSLIALGLGPKRNLSARSTTESRPRDDNRRTEGSERP